MSKPIAELSLISSGESNHCGFYLIPPYFPHKDWVTRKLSLKNLKIRSLEIDIFRPTYYRIELGNRDKDKIFREIKEYYMEIHEEAEISIFDALTTIGLLTNKSIFEIASNIQKDGNIRKLTIFDSNHKGNTSDSLDQFIKELSLSCKKTTGEIDVVFYAKIDGLYWEKGEFIKLPQFIELGIINVQPIIINAARINEREKILLDVIKEEDFDPQKLSKELFILGRTGGIKKKILVKLRNHQRYISLLEVNRSNKSKNKIENAFEYDFKKLVKKQYIKIIE